jgi:hypothetical protein
MQQASEKSQRRQSRNTERARPTQINAQIEDALSLLANNPAVSAEVVRTIRNIYVSHTQSGTAIGVRQSDSSSLSDDEAAANQPHKAPEAHPEAKADADSAGERSSEDESAHAGPAGGGCMDAGKRLHLTEDQVIEIYNLRPQYGRQGRLRRGSMLRCKTIAPRYGVTPKTIRDIWCGRTWPQTTEHLWTDEERAARQSLRKPDALRGHDVKQALEDLRVSFLGASATPAAAPAAAAPSPTPAEEVSWATAIASPRLSASRSALSPSSSFSSPPPPGMHRGEERTGPGRPGAGMGSSEWLSRLADSAAAASGARAGETALASRQRHAPPDAAAPPTFAQTAAPLPPFRAPPQLPRPLLPPLRLGQPQAGDAAGPAVRHGGGTLPASAEAPGMAGALSLLEGLYGASSAGGPQAHAGLLSSLRDAVQLSLLWNPAPHSAPAAAAAAAAAAAQQQQQQQQQQLPPLRFVAGREHSPAAPLGVSPAAAPAPPGDGPGGPTELVFSSWQLPAPAPAAHNHLSADAPHEAQRCRPSPGAGAPANR